MNSNKMNPRRSTKGFHTRCTLEAITEEKELENIIKDSLRNVPTKKSTTKSPENNFTPFSSSWSSRCAATQKITQSTEAKGNLRHQYETLKSDYKELFELARHEELNKKVIFERVKELEKECQNLRHQAEKNLQKLTIELKNAEQMKVDYEFMLETQNRIFKRRERELLEQIDSCSAKIDADVETSMEKDSFKSTVNIFEYEELSEKLQSFEKQNKFLQSSNDVLEIQNRILKDALIAIKASLRPLKSHYDELKIRNMINQPSSSFKNTEQLISEKTELYESNFESDGTNDELSVDQEITEDFQKESKKLIPLKKTLAEEITSSIKKILQFVGEIIPFENDRTTEHQSSANNELKQVLVNLNNVIKLKSQNREHSSKCISRLTEPKHKELLSAIENKSEPKKSLADDKIKCSNEFGDGSSESDIINLLHICLAQLEAIYETEKRNTESDNKLKMENDSLDDLYSITLKEQGGNNTIRQLRINDMNLSDSEKINKSNVFKESREKSKVQTFDLIIQKLKLRHENDKVYYTELQEIYESTHTTLMKQDEEIKVLLIRNEDHFKKIATLNRERHEQKSQYEKLANILKEKEEIILSMKNEQIKNQTEKQISFEIISHLKTLTNNYKTELKKLCDISTDNVNKILDVKNVKLERSEEKIQPTEEKTGFVHRSKEEYIETDINHKFSESQANNSLQNEEQIKHDTEEFNLNILTLKKKLIKLIYENKNLKEVISKINSHIQYTKEIFTNFKRLQIEEVSQQIRTLKFDLLEVKNGFELIIELVQRENQKKNQLTNALQEKMEKLVQINKNLDMNKKILNNDHLEIEGKLLINDIEEIKNDNDNIFKNMDKSMGRMNELNGLKKQEEECCYLKKNLQPKLTDIEYIENRGIAVIHDRAIFKSNQGSNIELPISDEYKKEDKWKQLRNREHDSRRNIDLNTLCSETTMETCNNCDNKNNLNTEVTKQRGHCERLEK